MTDQISKAFRAWLSSLDRGRTIDFEQAFAAGYSAGTTPADRPPYDLRLAIGKALDRCVCDDSTPEQVDAFIAVFSEFGLSIAMSADTTAREWNLDMTTAPHDGTIVEVAARYPNAMNGYPRYAAFKWEEDAWFEYTKHQPERVIPWAWRPRTSWPDAPKERQP